MKLKTLKPFIWISILILIVSLACSAGAGSPDDSEQPPIQETKEIVSQVTEEVDSEAAVSDLEDVRQAVIQIESQGTFIDPEFGLIVNGSGNGSGFIIDPSGLAVTNNHVVTGAGLINVRVGGETATLNAKIIGVSECSDLAVIDIDGEGYQYLKWYEDPIRVGMDVYVSGFPLGDPEFSLTKGVISKLEADGETSWASVDSVLEYDATSNPGNSGGPVVNPDGEVMAVHYAGNATTRQAFGISRDEAINVVEELAKGVNIDTIGINGQAVNAEDESLSGIWVSSVQSGSLADQAGVLPGDIITMMEYIVLASEGTMAQYCDILRTHNPEDTLSIQIVRWIDGEVLEGQINGRELAVVGTFGEGTTGNGETGEIINPEASESGDIYYLNEFERNLSDWSYFLTSGEDDGFTAEITDSSLRFDIEEENTWIYYIFDAYEFFDVRIDTFAENLGMNNNNVSLICRESEDGWYEFNIANNGTYWIYWFDDIDRHDYVLLFSGGSKAINMGKDVNGYTAICNGNELTLMINGEEVRTVTDNNLESGKIGISLSSFDVTPIIVEFDYFEASVP